MGYHDTVKELYHYEFNLAKVHRECCAMYIDTHYLIKEIVNDRDHH